jgi:urease accessory protein
MRISRTGTVIMIAITVAMITAMTETSEAAALLKLTNWLSPAYPVGAFSYSHGLEQAVAQGDVHTLDSTRVWLDGILHHGAGWTDAVLLAQAWHAAARQDQDQLSDVAELASAFFPCAERQLEAMAQGDAFTRVTQDVWTTGGMTEKPMPHAVAVGAFAGAHGVALELTLPLYLQAFVSNLIFAAIRLVPLGQTDGQRILAELHPAICALAQEAACADIDDIGGCALLADLSAMDHETLETRLFRT